METKTTFTSLLMHDYIPGVCTDLMFRDNTELEPLFKRRQRAGGDELRRPVITARASGSTKAHTETGALAPPAQREKTVAVDTIKYVATSKEVSQHLLNVTKMKKYAYLEAVDSLVNEAIDELRDFKEKHFFATAGFLGSVASGSSTAVTMATGTNMDQFEPGMAIAVLVRSDGSTGNGHAGTTVVSTSGLVITTADAMAGSLDTTFGVCATGSVSGATNLMPNGLGDIIAETDLHGIEVATYTTYKSYVEPLNDSLQLTYVQKVVDKLEMRRGARLDRIWGHDELLRKYQFELIDPRTIQQPEDGRTGTGKVYFKGRSKSKALPIEALVYCNPTNKLLFIQDSVIEIWYTAFNQWMADDTGKILHKITGYAGYECDLGSEYQVMSVERYKLGALDNIT